MFCRKKLRWANVDITFSLIFFFFRSSDSRFKPYHSHKRTTTSLYLSKRFCVRFFYLFFSLYTYAYSHFTWKRKHSTQRQNECLKEKNVETVNLFLTKCCKALKLLLLLLLSADRVALPITISFGALMFAPSVNLQENFTGQIIMHMSRRWT